MVEIELTYDLLPDADLKAYVAWATKAMDAVVHAPRIVEFRANRSLFGSPQIRTVTIWHTLADWARFDESSWGPLEAELRRYATNLRIEAWGPSPVVPEILRPAGK